MRQTWIPLIPLLVVGCATQRPNTTQTSTSVQPAAIPALSSTRVVETRYDVRGYREATDQTVRHETHAVFRRTRVPSTADEDLETVPRTVYAPASYAPLPANDELAAELTTQRKITSQLKAMQSSIAEAEQRVQAQYALLVRQSAEAMKVREQLEAERSRVRSTPVANSTAAPASATVGKPSDVKW